jgi:hypothetical protein
MALACGFTLIHINVTLEYSATKQNVVAFHINRKWIGFKQPQTDVTKKFLLLSAIQFSPEAVSVSLKTAQLLG